MAKYALTQTTNIVHRTTDNASIPDSLANNDYQEYLEWCKVPGNTPDPVPTPTAQQTAMQQLATNDAIMFRVLELLIDVLLAKNIIVATDFPPAVRAMYQARKALRTQAGVP